MLSTAQIFAKVRAARAARLFLLVKPKILLFRGVLVDDRLVDRKVPIGATYWVRSEGRAIAARFNGHGFESRPRLFLSGLSNFLAFITGESLFLAIFFCKCFV